MVSFGNRDSKKHVPTEKRVKCVGVLAFSWFADINDTSPAGLINNFLEKSLQRASVDVCFIKSQTTEEKSVLQVQIINNFH